MYIPIYVYIYIYVYRYIRVYNFMYMIYIYTCIYVSNIKYFIDTPIIHLYVSYFITVWGIFWVAALLGGEPIRHVFAFLDEEPLKI